MVVSYITKDTASGIPYVDIDYQNGYIYAQETGAPTLKSFTFTGNYRISPPAGKKWILRSITVTWVAAVTQTDYPQFQIYPSNFNDISVSALNLYFGTLDVTAGDTYIVDLAEYVQSRASSLIGSDYTTEQVVPNKFELYDTEIFGILIGNETATITAYLSYIEVNLG